MKRLPLFSFLLAANFLFAQIPHLHQHDRAIQFPDVPGYKTVVCDFHIHTVFSDGSVWPDIRVQEAVRDSVDAISLTEHLEYQPHKDDIPHPDRNRAYVLAEQYARPYNLIVVAGSEITRDMPPGHSNALFITDANKLMIEDPVAVFKEAKNQGAFTFWNHPNWIAQRQDGVATMTDMHKMLVKDGLLHGIEVVNDITYSDEALQIALDYNLTIMGTSDVHGLVDWGYKLDEGGHRPVTLVFAKEKTAEGIKEALFARRTVAWHNNTLIGRQEHLLPLIESSITVQKAEYQGPSAVVNVFLKNDSDAMFVLSNKSKYTFQEDAGIVMLQPHGTAKVEVKTLEQLKEFELEFEVLNVVTAPGKHPVWKAKVEVK